MGHLYLMKPLWKSSRLVGYWKLARGVKAAGLGITVHEIVWSIGRSQANAEVRN